MRRYVQEPGPLLVISVILAALLLAIILFFGLSPTTRGPIEILLALLIAAVALLFRAYTRRVR
jgi:hypothetical protein